jgi:hypothetical protein
MYNSKNYLHRTGTSPEGLRSAQTQNGCSEKQPPNELNEYTYAIKKGQVLANFSEDFYLKYKNNLAFRYTIESLIRNKSQYDIIQALIKIIDDQQKVMQEFLTNHIPPIIFVK